MKIRHGFVSNSSSQSFCIYGIYLDEEPKGDLDGLSMECTERDEVCVGRSWASVKDDETGKQFKEDVEKKVKALFGEDKKCNTHEYSWYNG